MKTMCQDIVGNQKESTPRALGIVVLSFEDEDGGLGLILGWAGGLYTGLQISEANMQLDTMELKRNNRKRVS